jgi:hypothetical protein
LTVFLAKTHTTMHALHALEANLRGVVDSLQFFQLGNYLTLIDTRKRLDKQLAVLHSPHRPFRITAADADAAADDDAAGGHRRALPLDESLESVVASLVDLTTVLKPAARRTEPVSRERFTEALMVVQVSEAWEWFRCATLPPPLSPPSPPLRSHPLFPPPRRTSSRPPPATLTRTGRSGGGRCRSS